jgi:hypothetical protein
VVVAGGRDWVVVVGKLDVVGEPDDFAAPPPPPEHADSAQTAASIAATKRPLSTAAPPVATR